MDSEWDYDKDEDDINGKNLREKKLEYFKSYESDSSIEESDDNEDKRLDLNADNNGKQVAENEEYDMFSSDEDKGNSNTTKQSIFGVEYEPDELDNELPKAENNEEDEGRNSDDSNREELSEDTNEYDVEGAEFIISIEDRDAEISRKRSKWMPKLEAFNLDQERLEGSFDNEGNYISNNDNKEPNIEEEDWMHSSASEIKNASKAKGIREAKEKLSHKKFVSLQTLLGSLVSLLQPDENALELIQRIQGKKHRNRQNKRSFRGTTVDSKSKELIMQITGICNSLINEKNIDNAFELSREALMRIYKTKTGREIILDRSVKKRPYSELGDMGTEKLSECGEDDNIGPKIWEFKWAKEDSVHGPYTTFEMLHWSEDYFNENVLVRKVGSKEFRPLYQVQFEN